MKTALIDADIIVYQAAYAFQRKGEEIGSWSAVETYVDNLVRDIVTKTGCDRSALYLTGKGNFRHALATIKPYKGNRSDREKPFHLNNIKTYLISRYDAEVVDGMEADDALAIAQTASEEGTTVICSIDKDLLQVPGLHYNWRKEELTEVDPLTAWYNLYTQALCGDPADNIPGVDGVGPKRAASLLEGAESKKELDILVKDVYESKYGEDWYTRFAEAMMLLHLVREADEQGNPIIQTWP